MYGVTEKCNRWCWNCPCRDRNIGVTLLPQLHTLACMHATPEPTLGFDLASHLVSFQNLPPFDSAFEFVLPFSFSS